MDEQDKEIERILKEVYYNPLDGLEEVKRAIVITEYRYVTYLVELGLIKRLKNVGGNGKYGLQLENKGYEVFEKYNGWLEYKKKVIDKQIKVQYAVDKAKRYWWIPIIISLISLVISFIAIFYK